MTRKFAGRYIPRTVVVGRDLRSEIHLLQFTDLTAQSRAIAEGRLAAVMGLDKGSDYSATAVEAGWTMRIPDVLRNADCWKDKKR